jgi:colicin import membrane protein
MSTTNEVMQVTTALAQFDKVAAGLGELEKAYKGVIYDVQTKDGMKAAVLARRTIKEPRIEVEKLRKDAKKPILELGRKLDNEAARITAALESLENPIDMQIKTEEDRLHNEAVARAAAETKRVEALEARLEALQLMPFDAQGLTSAQCQACLDEARALKIGDDWQEYAEKAERAKISAVAALEGMVEKAKAAEAEAAKIIADRAELEALRAKQAEADKIERERVAAEQKAERERLEAAKREQDRIEKERQDALKIEQEKLDAERAKLEILKKEQVEQLRIGAINFRAHHDKLTPKQKLHLQIDSDANPSADVWTLPLYVEPVTFTDIVLSDEPAVKESLTTDFDTTAAAPSISRQGFDRWFDANGYDDEHRAMFLTVWEAACEFCEERL